MQEYISKQQQILRPAEQIYAVISRFDNLTPAVADKVEEWQATEDTCSFKAKGFTVKLRMEEREAPRHVKIVADGGGVPMDFAFWIQLHKVSDTDTRMRLVLHIDENDDRRQTPRRTGSDRRRHRQGDERRTAILTERRHGMRDRMRHGSPADRPASDRKAGRTPEQPTRDHETYCIPDNLFGASRSVRRKTGRV